MRWFPSMLESILANISKEASKIQKCMKHLRIKHWKFKFLIKSSIELPILYYADYVLIVLICRLKIRFETRILEIAIHYDVDF